MLGTLARFGTTQLPCGLKKGKRILPVGNQGPEQVTIVSRRLSSGYWLIKGDGPNNFAQPPYLPCSKETLLEHASPEASGEFIEEAMRQMEGPITPVAQ